jgi:hypothetical protein
MRQLMTMRCSSLEGHESVQGERTNVARDHGLASSVAWHQGCPSVGNPEPRASNRQDLAGKELFATFLLFGRQVIVIVVRNENGHGEAGGPGLIHLGRDDQENQETLKAR